MKKYPLRSEHRYIETSSGRMKLILLRSDTKDPVPGILWIHGGGYMLGMAAMVHWSKGKMLAGRYGAVVVSPEYRLAGRAPYPAALNDCMDALRYLYRHAEELGVDPERIIVGGESAGGGLAAAVCLYNRDHDRIPVCMQIPLYPMLDCEDTPSSADNHGKVWNTRRNHRGWSVYLRDLYRTDRVPKYASVSRETDYRGLPAAYTYVLDGEPFHDETLAYINSLQEAGIPAHVDVYHGDIHSFDALFWTKNARDASAALCRAYEAIVLEDRKQ
ncbi:MAG: alpha/beta hydrolase [Solobacterium sp.]|nr:alpha/beta hydrolase [Solobacterium sp.]